MTQTRARFADFRIFIDAATLKLLRLGRKYGQKARDFRIFIDAATLKHRERLQRQYLANIFPHLYRCGHIEAALIAHDPHTAHTDFRIFIDAATLKRRANNAHGGITAQISASL